MGELHVADSFSRYLGGRFRKEGSFSGEAFREDMLWPAVRAALDSHETLRIVFDGVAGMPPSFLEEAFAGILRRHPEVTADELLETVKLEAKDPELWPFIKLTESFISQQASRS